jgi:predicted membrane protein
LYGFTHRGVTPFSYVQANGLNSTSLYPIPCQRANEQSMAMKKFILCTLYLVQCVDYNNGRTNLKELKVLIQLMIVTVLLLVLFFGIGFILNMLMKTTWFPIYAYFAVVIIFVVYWGTAGSLTSNVSGYTFADYIPAVGGLVGAILSGSAIKALRVRGFKMF